MARYDLGVFIGRFQPPHAGHVHVIREALLNTGHLVVLVGSANRARDPRNPFTYEERRAMIEAAFRHEVASGRLIVAPLDDHLYADDAWCAEVQATVAEVSDRIGGGTKLSTCLAGYGKDRSSYYLKLFPEWESIELGSQYGTFSSTDVRESFLRRIPSIPAQVLDPTTVAFLERFAMTEPFRALLAETEFLADYAKRWGPGAFVTVDAVVVQSGHILLVERGEHPGRGLLALPGGFVERHEHIRDAVVRELKEETQISDGKGEVPPAMLASFVDDTRTRVFDDPDRSLRARIITHAHLFRLPRRRTLMKVKGGDDARDARWYRIGDLDPTRFFEDHWFIVKEMLNL